jgi:hypothetical protein
VLQFFSSIHRSVPSNFSLFLISQAPENSGDLSMYFCSVKASIIDHRIDISKLSMASYSLDCLKKGNTNLCHPNDEPGTNQCHQRQNMCFMGMIHSSVLLDTQKNNGSQHHERRYDNMALRSLILS